MLDPLPAHTVIFEIGISLTLFMKAGFGSWSDEIDLMWWVVTGGALGFTLQSSHAYTPLLASNLHILSLCFILFPSLLPGYQPANATAAASLDAGEGDGEDW